MAYHSEAAKVRDLPQVMQYVQGRILDIACGNEKITPQATGVDGRALPGVDIVTDDLVTLWDTQRYGDQACEYDTIFSSHFLEHIEDPAYMIHCWSNCLKSGGHLVLYLPDKSLYDSHQNPEHMMNWSYEDFIFFFKRVFCGEGKNFKGEHLEKKYELLEHGIDKGEDKYSFYLAARKV